MGLAGKDLLEETKIEQIAFSLQDFRYPFTQVVLEKDPEIKVKTSFTACIIISEKEEITRTIQK